MIEKELRILKTRAELERETHFSRGTSTQIYRMLFPLSRILP